MLAQIIVTFQLSTAEAQNAVFTYQGLVQDNGANFTGTGQFEFALVTSSNISSQATASLTMGNTSDPGHWYVASVGLVSGGSGYVNPPAVTFTGGGGSGAAAHTTVSGGAVNAIFLDTTGSFYSSAPTITMTAPPATIAYTTYWSNDGSSSDGSEPASAVSVPVSNGLFSVGLGDTTQANMTAIPASVLTQPNLQLLIWFSDGVNGFALLNPPQKLTSAPTAIFAQSASNLLGSLPASQLTGSAPAAALSGTYSNQVTLDNMNNVFEGLFAGDGGGLTNIIASQVVADANNDLLLGSENSSTTNDFKDTALGFEALENLTNGIYNTAVGIFALKNGTSAAGNTAVGANALNTVNTQGKLQLPVPFTGRNNLALGYDAAVNFDTNESDNIIIGHDGVAGDNRIIRIGTTTAGLGNGQTNTFIAGIYGASPANASPVFINSSGQLGTVGTLEGDGSGLTNIIASQIVADTNTDNVFLGSAGNSTTNALNNTAVGFDALENLTNGDDNTAVGLFALRNGTSAADNTAVGANALNTVTLGKAPLPAPFTGVHNIALGSGAGEHFSSNESDNIIIDNAGVSGDNKTIRIGTTSLQTNTFIAGISGVTVASGVEVFVNPSGQLGTATSSARFKRDIQSMDDASDVLFSLRPVTFKYKPELDPLGLPQFGLVAEEVDKVDPDLVARDEQGQINTVRYNAVNAMLLNEFLKEHHTIQEQERKMEEQNSEIQNLQKQNDSLAARLNELEATVRALADKK